MPVEISEKIMARALTMYDAMLRPFANGNFIDRHPEIAEDEQQLAHVVAHATLHLYDVLEEDKDHKDPTQNPNTPRLASLILKLTNN